MCGKLYKYTWNIFEQLGNTLKIRSIQFIITFSFAFVTIFTMLIVGITLYNKFSNSEEENAAIYARQTVDQFVMNMDYYLRAIMEISDSINDIVYYSEDISNKKIKDQMNVVLGTRKDIVTLAVFSQNGDMVVGVPTNKIKSNRTITEQDWFKQPIAEPANLFVSSPHVQNIFEGQHSWVVSLSREITYNQNGRKLQGILMVDINFSAMDQLCKSVQLGKRGYIFLVDRFGNIVFHPQLQLINAGLKSENLHDIQEHVIGRYIDIFNGERRLTTIQTMYYTRWRVVGVAYMDEFVTTQKEIRRYVGWTILLGIFFATMVSAIISAKIAQPIKKLEKSMKMVEKGQFDITVEASGEDEVVKLSNTFNLMLSRIRQLMNQIVLEQEAKRKSELNALQAQINPHFLYNTLDSIVWMAENEKSNEVITMVTALARLFRISISRGKNVITVREELEHARNYLIIQKIRYKNKFRFEINAEEEILSYKTLKLILQPIIENAIYHGIEYMVDEGLIKITVGAENGKLSYQVSDNGVGMSSEKIKTILSKESKNKESSGVGVKNVHERIQLFYGNEYGLEIESEIEVGTDVRIMIPLVEDREMEDYIHEESSKTS